MDLNLEDEDNLDFDISNFKDIEDILNDSDSESSPKESRFKLVTRRIDTNKIRHKRARNLQVHTSLVKNVKMELDNPVRCGVIIYTKSQGNTYFCMGVDSVYGDLSDFGGGIKKDETIVGGGLRELKEESLGIFGEISENEIQNCMAFYSNNMMIIFVYRNVNRDEIRLEFERRKKDVPDLEVSSICWIEKEEFLNSILCKGKRLYSRVRKILSKVTDIISIL